MRYLPAALREKLLLAVQAESTKAAPSVDLWISRPTVPLTGPAFLERQLVGAYTAIQSISIAECHPMASQKPMQTYIAFIDSGTARVLRAANTEEMAGHVWSDTGFSAAAVDIAIAFDGTMPRDTRGRVEFVTESLPWVFWIGAGGVLYGQKLGDADPVVLALQNATSVSAVRAMWSETGGFDFGLVVFFLLAGDIYYRQLIGGTWSDAEPVRFGPDATYVKIAASRTWDYRIALQALASDGTLYELFTQFAGIGKQNVEHLEVTDVGAEAEIIKVAYRGAKTEEHVEVSGLSAAGTRVYGLSTTPLSVTNLDDGTGNWGLFVQVVLDYPVTGAMGSHASFVLTDSSGVTFTATSIMASDDGLTLTLAFPDFNSASGKLTLYYTPGTIQSPATVKIPAAYFVSNEIDEGNVKRYDVSRGVFSKVEDKDYLNAAVAAKEKAQEQVASNGMLPYAQRLAGLEFIGLLEPVTSKSGYQIVVVYGK